MIHPTAKVSEQVSPPKNTILQLSTPYTDPNLSNSPPLKPQMLVCHLRNTLKQQVNHANFLGLPPLRCEKTGRGDEAPSTETLKASRGWGNGEGVPPSHPTRGPGSVVSSTMGSSQAPEILISGLFPESKARYLCCYFAKFITFS